MAISKTPPKRASLPPVRRSSLNMKAVQLPKTITFMVTDGEKSVCPVCGGDVVHGTEVVETATSHRQKDIGIFCTKCGIRYEFHPKRVPRMTRR